MVVPSVGFVSQMAAEYRGRAARSTGLGRSGLPARPAPSASRCAADPGRSGCCWPACGAQPVRNDHLECRRDAVALGAVLTARVRPRANSRRGVGRRRRAASALVSPIARRSRIRRQRSRYSTRWVSTSATGRAKPGPLQQRRRGRGSRAIGSTRGDRPPVTSVSASASTARNSCSVWPPNSDRQQQPVRAQRAAALDQLARPGHSPSAGPARGPPDHARRASAPAPRHRPPGPAPAEILPELRMPGHDRRAP